MTEVQQTEKVTPRLKTKYRDEIRGALQELSLIHISEPTRRS